MSYPYTVTSDSVVVIVNNKPTTVRQGAPNYEPLRQAIIRKNWPEVEKHLGITSSLEAWSKGNFKIQDNKITYKGEELPEEISERMFAMMTAGESPEPLMKFWEKLQQNPSWRSVQQLFPFLKHQGIPIQSNGNFLAYKGINSNYTDCHTGRVDNKPGVVNEMPRNRISDDPNKACHYGFHVGTLTYARDFAKVVVVCEVDPADVVCIPHDCGQQKMRVCRYKVIGNHNGEFLPSTSYELEKELEETVEIEAFEDEEYEDESEEQASEVKTKSKERQLKKPRDANKRPKLKIPKEYRKMHAMGMVDLLKQPIGDLRTYASKVLHIVGASKIPGGKTALVWQIMKVRKDFA